MTSKQKLFGYVIFVLALFSAVIVGRLFGEWFVGHFLARLPSIFQNPILSFFCIAIPDGLYINPCENRYLWARFIDKLDSDYEQRSKIAPINVGLLVGFFSAWTSPSTDIIDFFFKNT